MSDSEEPRDEASPDDCNVDGPEATEDAESDFRPFDEVDEEFQPGPDQRRVGPDGLPITVDGTGPTDIPSLSTKTLVCMGDFRQFVVRNEWGEVIVYFDANDVERAPDGRYRIKQARLAELYKSVIEEEKKKPFYLGVSAERAELEVLENQGLQLRLGWLVVEPIRPPCKHYVRQKTSFNLNAQHNVFIRLCAARRTTEGTFMSVRDTGMYACDMREPFDAESVAELDEFDRLKVEQGRRVTHLPLVGGSIFDSK